MATPIEAPTLDFSSRFPEGVVADERKGFEGYIVDADKLIEFATALRDEFGYDYLSSVTGVDYVAEEMLEVVYHAYKTIGGAGLVYKVQVARDKAEVLAQLVIGHLEDILVVFDDAEIGENGVKIVCHGSGAF